MTMKIGTHTQATGGKAIRAALGRLELRLTFRANGRKSSDGDGRTAADIRRELALDANKES